MIIEGILYPLLVICISALGVFSLRLYPLTDAPDTEVSPPLNLEYENLSIEQMKRINLIMSDLDPAFLVNVEKFIFTSKIECDDCIGLNINNGELIYIQNFENDNYLKKLICHEIFHSYIFSLELESEEKIVDNLGETAVCFKSGRWRHL
jgi:hypothetical protein